MNPPIFVSYYTPLYAGEASRLRQSCVKFGLEKRTHIVAIADRGGWQQCTQYKPTFLNECLSEFPSRPIVWLDCDMTLESKPELFDTMDEQFDIAVHWRQWPGNSCSSTGHNLELLSGTIFLANTMAAREVLREWIIQNIAYPKLRDQENLDTVLHFSTRTTRIGKLPAAYCKIHDRMPEAGEHPVIVDWQASQRIKRTESHAR